ncbi:putative ER-associated proteolytic system protein Der1 [Piedraia hortae CBS 480.64]|uniref:Derlin n=1 Tax=Piedraia hortae CBS 480.64 TaxID=1314780 RepID=A0A6A7C2Z2_9PEZI|nr:putative ER-associated proteolytic system protein Der1 [Piedraia hortae CBS 480.64]
MLGGGEGMPIEQWFLEMPICTRWWTVATMATGALVLCKVLTPFQLFYSFRAVYYKQQYWRILTSFIYFGPLSLSLLYNIFFIQHYARALEESYAGVAQFSWLLLYSSAAIVAVAPLFNQEFLGGALTATLVYLWCRRNSETRLILMGLVTVRAEWLPWVLIGVKVAFNGRWPMDDLCGLIIGHIVCYFFNDIYPATHGGYRPLDPPQWWIRLVEGNPAATPDAGVQEAAMNRRDMAPAVRDVR